MKRKFWLLPLFLLWACSALALDIVPYDAAAFATAREEGKPTGLLFHTGWCPTCILQERSLESLRDDPSLAGITVYLVDYYKREDLRKQFNVRSFSTLIVFKGSMERARIVAGIREKQLKEVLLKAF